MHAALRKAMGSRRPTLSLAVQNAAPGHAVPTRRQLSAWAGNALERDAEVTLRLVQEAEGRRLNRDYRGQDHATNVLTFAYEAAGSDRLSGDIVLCAPVVEREAAAQRKALEAHYAHLVVHGMLHLQGYDHENEADAHVMEGRETQIVIQLGYPDPYAGGG
jgi:probable rRNA maturation factor